LLARLLLHTQPAVSRAETATAGNGDVSSRARVAPPSRAEGGNDMGIGWEPIRLAEWNDPANAQFSRPPEEEVESDVAAGRSTSLQAAERSLAHHWSKQVPKEQFIAGLRALADALSQEQNFTFSVDHQFMVMRPRGTPSIEYNERENQRKEVTFRFSWEA